MAFNFTILYKRVFRIALKVGLWFVGITFIWVLLARFIPIFFTPLMGIRMVEQMSAGKQVVFKKDWEPLDHISENLVLAVICSEDQHFEMHNGFDIEAIQKAFENNKKRRKRGRPVHGASTISQQVAKNVFLWQGRSWIRKGFEVYFTFMIETIWSKRRIMEVYLNVIEMGDGIYGAEAASNFYYKKHAKDLNRQEAAGIASVLPNPRKWSPINPGPYIAKKQDWIVHQMRFWIDGIDLTDDEIQMPKEE
ncbi:MAG: monofunctional biosynthetic peptidoglycan transglycosylase [Saprospiraceae bacterium]|jgi:monofunctional biosynthetic peptidoglycan transglycosylase